MNQDDRLPGKPEFEWSCGHASGAVCADCYHILAGRANELARENLELRARLASRPVRKRK
jgi:hypothetical protein